MAEKYLKGLLTHYEVRFRKVHDLLELESMLLEHCPEVSYVHEALIELNRFYIATRYPGDFPEFSITDAEGALVAAIQVKRFVEENIAG